MNSDENNPEVTEQISAAPMNAGGKRWISDRGAMPGEPAHFLDGDADTAKAAIFEIDIPGKGVLFEARDGAGNLIKRASTLKEATEAAEERFPMVWTQLLPTGLWTVFRNGQPVAGDQSMDVASAMAHKFAAGATAKEVANGLLPAADLIRIARTECKRISEFLDAPNPNFEEAFDRKPFQDTMKECTKASRAAAHGQIQEASYYLRKVGVPDYQLAEIPSFLETPDGRVFLPAELVIDRIERSFAAERKAAQTEKKEVGAMSETPFNQAPWHYVGSGPDGEILEIRRAPATGKSIAAVEAELQASGVEGEDYLWKASELLSANGFCYNSGGCTCRGGGEYGHHFACGYVRPDKVECQFSVAERTTGREALESRIYHRKRVIDSNISTDVREAVTQGYRRLKLVPATIMSMVIDPPKEPCPIPVPPPRSETPSFEPDM